MQGDPDSRDVAGELAHQGVFRSLPIATLVLELADGHAGAVLDANPAAQRLLGRDGATLVGLQLHEVFEDCTPRLQAALARAIERHEIVTTERRVATTHGVSLVQAEFQRVDWAGAPALVLFVRELADRQAAEWLLRRRDAQLTKLSWASRRLNEVLEEREILRRLVSSGMEVLGAAGGMSGMFDDGHIHYAEYADVDGFRPLGLTMSADDGVPGVVRETSGVFRTNDAPRRVARGAAFDDLPEPTSVLAAPIFDREGDLLGCVELHDKVDGEPYTEYDGLILLGLATGAAVALENARMLQELRRMRQELLDGERRLRGLAAELSRSEERERRRIAEELHDLIGQELAVLRMRVSQAATLHGGEGPTGLFDEVNALLSSIIGETRSLTAEISPPMLYTLGLRATLEWLGEKVEEQHGLAVAVHCDCDGYRLPDDMRALVYVSVRELLRNVVKHAQASSVEVSLVGEGDTVLASVRDDGVGFTPEVPTDTYGLFSVRERVAAAGGTMAVSSAPGTGTTVSIRVPAGPAA